MPRVTVKMLEQRIDTLEVALKYRSDQVDILREQLRIVKSHRPATEDLAMASATAIDASAHTIAALTQIIKNKL